MKLEFVCSVNVEFWEEYFEISLMPGLSWHFLSGNWSKMTFGCQEFSVQHSVAVFHVQNLIKSTPHGMLLLCVAVVGSCCPGLITVLSDAVR